MPDSVPKPQRNPSNQRGRAQEVWLLVAWVVLPLLPFVPGAISIDGPVFVEVAQQILIDPGDPYGFEMIWDPTSPKAAVFNRNPPLLSYYLAPFIALFGESDAVLHAALLPFPLIAALAFLGISRRLCGEGLAPSALLVSTPAFLVLATTLMLDVPTLALWLASVFALLRASETGLARWGWAAGFCAAAAGLMKYVGFSTAPLLAAGVVLLSKQVGWKRAAPMLRAVGVPIAVWALWGAYTHAVYGEVHFLGSTDVVTDMKKWQIDEFWNHTSTVFVYIGAALLFPIAIWLRVLLRGSKGIELAIVGVLIGTVVVVYVLPEGDPPRRVPLDLEGSLLAALGFAGSFLLVARSLRRKLLLGAPTDRFLLLWLGGTLFFSMFLNWHVNAADALLAAPPLLLLLFRDRDLRPTKLAALAVAAVALPLSFLLAWADMEQADSYRTAAANIAAEIGDQAGARYFVGQWGLQHYLEQQGFRAVVPPMYGRTDLAAGDWIATARNVAQLDVSQNMSDYQMHQVWSRSFRSWLPLRTTNADAGAGFYSHHSGYVPWGWSSEPIEHFQLGRVTGRR
ncbi:MAG: glycosyltransferase family 39 protein [Myxococcota bacterium]